jgi:serine/threonine protein kinase
MSLTSLQSLWNLPASSLPELIEISRVHLLHQLYESVSLVQSETPQGLQIRTLKALTSYSKYIYHELKLLLTLPPHPNIISRPSHLVTKKCGFGGKTAVVGFMTEYQSLGTLQALLPFRRIHGTLRYADQLKWAIQLTSALVHIYEHGRFYSDLRLDNILLSATEDLVMVDFEQRGVWCGFAAPEVNYLDQVYMLATDSTIPKSVKREYDMLLQRCLKGYEKLQEHVYQDPEHGYYIPWLCLSAKEQEAATVYMLGRVLWCIFEGLSNPEVAVWQSYPHESELEFPNYRNTPLNLRMLIDQCTKGRNVSGNQGEIVRKGNSLVLREGNGTDTMTEVQDKARRWWRKELSKGKEFLKNRESGQLRGEAGSCFDRIKLKEVLMMLKTFSSTSP